MKLLQRLSGRGRRRQGNRLEALRARLESFMRPAMALVDPRELTIPARREAYALYLYGAATALAEDQELGETEALALLVMSLRASASPRLHEQEVSHLVGRAMALAAAPSRSSAFEAGAEAMAQWLAGDAGTAVGRLARVLQGRT